MQIGGLAAGLEREGFRFDGGPYLLLDRPGLEWAFRELGLDLAEQVPMRRVEDIYQVEAADGSVVRISADLDETARRDSSERGPAPAVATGSSSRGSRDIHERLRPLLTSPRPGPAALLGSGAWRDLPFLLRSLRSVLASARLPQAVADAVAIWTHVAGQTTAGAPSPLAFVTAILHGVGAFVPSGRDRCRYRWPWPRRRARRASSSISGTPVAAIQCDRGRARGVTTAAGTVLEADAVVSNRNGIGTYLELARAGIPIAARRRLDRLPLQSPGVCAYLAVRGGSTPPYLRFRLPGGGELCRLLVTPAAVVDGLERDGWVPARLIAPMALRRGSSGSGPSGQREYLERVLGRALVAGTRRRGPRPGCADADRLGGCVPSLPPEHEPGDDRPVDASRATGPPQPLRRAALPGWQRHSSGPVGQLLRDLGHPGRRPRNRGPRPDAARHDDRDSAERPPPPRGEAGQRSAPGPAARLPR